MPSAAPLPDEGRVDGRRAGGERTRRKLVETAQALIAERGEDAIRLRELTDLAQTNMAAVHYHFGGLGQLLRTATTEAVELTIAAQIEQLDALAPDADLVDVAAAYVRPLIRAVSGRASPGRRYARVLARVASEPPADLRTWATEATSRAHDALIARTTGLLPELPEDELRFRATCVGGILVLISNPVFEPTMDAMSAEQIERRFAVVVAGALRGS